MPPPPEPIDHAANFIPPPDAMLARYIRAGEMFVDNAAGAL
jgi:hypothetical protein